jgi:hypothetical protein
MFKFKNLLPLNSFCLESSKLFGSKFCLEQTTVRILDIIFDTVNPYAESNYIYDKRDYMNKILDCFKKGKTF